MMRAPIRRTWSFVTVARLSISTTIAFELQERPHIRGPVDLTNRAPRNAVPVYNATGAAAQSNSMWRSWIATITLPPELENAVTEEVARIGATAEQLTLDVLQNRFFLPSSARLALSGATLADALGDYIGAVNTGDS